MGCHKLTYNHLQVVRTGELMHSHEAKSVQWFISIDPLAEKYVSHSPYAYCLNNPLIWTDPTGMSVEPGSQKEWDKQKKSVVSERDRLQAKVDKINADGAKKGWSAEKIAGKIGNLNDRIGSLNGSLTNLGTLEASTQVYSLNTISSTGIGGVTYDSSTGNVVISYGNTANFVHESTHAGQFETGDIAFDGNTGQVLGQDIFDEVAGYKAQYAYDPSSVSGLPSTSGTSVNSFNDITPAWIQGLDGGTLYNSGGRANTGISPVNINSSKADLIKAYPNNAATLQTLPSNFTLKTSYPSIYYKK